MDAVGLLRWRADVTQAELAMVAGTSQATIAAYESGRKSPTLRTLSRLAASVGLEATVSYFPPLTREDRRSLFLHRVIAAKLAGSPELVLGRARSNVDLMLDRQPGAVRLLTEWRAILDRSVEEIVEVMIDPGVYARDLRQVTPFAGVLDASERALAYKRFARTERRSA